MPRAVLIAGPTASGKSALAMALARSGRASGFSAGEIVNADSMQVYRELAIITARPSEADEQAVPHRLYGHIGAAESYSTGHWLNDVERVLDTAREAGALPVIVGGTGLYFKALIEGLSPVPEIPSAIRAEWRAKARNAAPGELHAELARRDAEMAQRLPATDSQRVLRALEVMDATGRSLADWQRTPGRGLLAQDQVRRVVIAPPREEIYRRCDARFDWMMQHGAMEEIERLARLALDPDLPAMRALGVRPLLELAGGRLSRPEAVERAKTETRQYAKRQLTWLRRFMADWEWLQSAEEFSDRPLRLPPEMRSR